MLKWSVNTYQALLYHNQANHNIHVLIQLAHILETYIFVTWTLHAIKHFIFNVNGCKKVVFFQESIYSVCIRF